MEWKGALKETLFLAVVIWLLGWIGTSVPMLAPYIGALSVNFNNLVGMFVSIFVAVLFKNWMLKKFGSKLPL